MGMSVDMTAYRFLLSSFINVYVAMCCRVERGHARIPGGWTVGLLTEASRVVVRK